MEGRIALAPRMGTFWHRMLAAVGQLDARPQAANLLLLGCWGVTRLALILGMVLGRHFCDPYFYHYAGQFAAGQWPYRDVPVEYPPLAMLLLLVPVLPLLPFGNLAPRPDLAFAPPITHMPRPDILRYSAYGLSFAVEMLLLDVITLWLVRVAARRFLPRDPQGLRAGLLYVLVIFLNGALLQKFDLAAGTLVLAAVLALVSRRPRWAWLALAGAALVKGFPVLLVPLFALYLARAGARGGWSWRAFGAALWQGARWCGGALAVVTVPVALFAGIQPILHTLLYHADRGTEIESLYANVLLAVGWLPGLGVSTAFHATDLSRVVLSPLARYVDAASYVLLGVFLAAAYGMVGWMWYTRARASGRDAVIGERDDAQLLGFGVVAVLLAFVLTFRALPAHYALVVVPLIVLLRLPGKMANTTWLAALTVLAVVGQVITAIWDPLRSLAPWAVAMLSARNLVWLLLFGLALAAPVLWLRALAPVGFGVRSAGARILAPKQVAREWRRLITSAPPIPGFSPRDEDVVAHLLSRVAPGKLVLAAGVCSTMIYLVFVVAFPITRYFNHPHVGSDANIINDMGRITGYSPLAAVGFVCAILLLFLCQFLALVGAGRAHGDDLGRSAEEAASWDRLIARYGAFFFPVAFILIMIWMQPVTTTDLYGYVARGYLFVFKHANPMITQATALPGGLQVNRPAAPYGPVWLLVAAAVSRLGGQNLLANMLGFKVIEAAATICALLLVDRLARQLYPARRLRVFVLFGWSPLLIFEAIGNGHNDIVMMVCVLAAFALMLRGRAQPALALLVVGALIKYVAAVFVPLWLVYELRRRGRLVLAARAAAGAKDEESSADGMSVDAPPTRIGEMVRGQARALAQTLQEVDRRQAFALIASAALIGGALVALAYAPFWVGLRTFTGLGQQLRPLYYNSSIVAFLTAPLQLFVSPSQFGALDKTVRLVFYVLFGSYVLTQMNRLWRQGALTTLREVVTSAAKITLAALILITFWYQPWYVVWLLPLAALSQEPYVRRAAAILAAGSLMTYAVSNYLFVGDQGLGQALFVQFFEILVTFGPLLLLRAAPNEEGLLTIGRRYLGSFGAGLRQHPVFWERVMLGLVLIVAAMLRLLRLGNLLTPISGNGGASQGLQQVSGDIGLFLADPQGLHGPFLVLRNVLVFVFGLTPLTVLLPSALIGTLTVLVIYLLTKEIMHQGGIPGKYGVALLAALLAATSRWHVSLSRSGMEVVLLPLLMCTALYWLLLAFRLGAPAGAVAAGGVETAKDVDPTTASLPSSGTNIRLRASVKGGSAQGAEKTAHGRSRACLLLYAGCGICTGLACDLAPGLWLLPLLVIGFLLAWRWRVGSWFAELRLRIGVLLGFAFLSGLPALGYLIGRQLGFPAGSLIFARSTSQPRPGPGLFSLELWGRIAQNIGDVLHLLIAQDYTAGYPAGGSAPIIPILLAPIFVLGVVLIVVRWRNLASLALLLLVALPLVASVAVGSPPNVIEAACVLPATCIVPALALYTIGVFLGHLPIVLDRINGSRIFTTPEQIGRVLLLIFLTVATIRTFYWCFEALLPSKPPNQDIPTYVAPQAPGSAVVAYRLDGQPLAQGDFGRFGLPDMAVAGIVHTRHIG